MSKQRLLEKQQNSDTSRSSAAGIQDVTLTNLLRILYFPAQSDWFADPNLVDLMETWFLSL